MTALWARVADLELRKPNLLRASCLHLIGFQ